MASTKVKNSERNIFLTRILARIIPRLNVTLKQYYQKKVPQAIRDIMHILREEKIQRRGLFYILASGSFLRRLHVIEY